MTRRLLAPLLSFLLAAGPGLSQTTDAELLAGIRQAQEGEFDAAVITLDHASKRLRNLQGRQKDLARACVYLSVAYLGLNREGDARTAAREAFRVDPSVQVLASEFPPRIVRFFEDVRKQEPASPGRPSAAATPEKATPTPGPATPAPSSGAGAPAPAQPAASSQTGAKKGGGAKLPLIILGVAAVGGGAVALAGGGGGGGNDQQPALSGVCSIANVRFQSTVFECPRGVQQLTDRHDVLVDFTNGTRATAAIQSATVAVQCVAAGGTPQPSCDDTRHEGVSVAPTNVASGQTSTLRIEVTRVCTNTFASSSAARFIETSARLSLTTSCATFNDIPTNNRHRTTFP